MNLNRLVVILTALLLVGQPIQAQKKNKSDKEKSED